MLEQLIYLQSSNASLHDVRLTSIIADGRLTPWLIG